MLLTFQILPQVAQAGNFGVFGPLDFAGKTVNTKTFSVKNPSIAYTLHIDNGGSSNQFARVVSSGLVKLNGVEIVSPSEFNQNVKVIEKPITLSTNNTITIDLSSNAESGLTLKVIGNDVDKPKITASVSPLANSGGWHKSAATVSFTCTDSTSDITACTSPVTVTTEGAAQSVQGTAQDQGGNTASTSVTINLDKTPPVVSITSPADGAILSADSVTFEGSASDALSGVTEVDCNGNSVAVSNGTFSCEVPLSEGANTLTVQSADAAGNSTSSSVNVTKSSSQSGIDIQQPANLSFFNISPIVVSGKVFADVDSVAVNGINANVINREWSASVPLQEGNNTLTAVAFKNDGSVGTDSIQVTLDTTPPHVTVESPPDGFKTTEEFVTVTGIVNDIVVGTVNSGQARVTVNGNEAQVANRTYNVAGIALQTGANTLQVIGTDQVGNSVTITSHVTREAVTQSYIKALSGNNQSGPVGTALGAPFEVQLFNNGNPVAGVPVIFKVTENDGFLTMTAGKKLQLVAVNTDADGKARATLTLGNRAGAGNNIVEAYATGYQGTALFIASGTPSGVAHINVDAGTNQFGATGSPLPLPFVAVVTDEGHNRLGGVPVTFTVKQGGGNIDGKTSIETVSDSDGRVVAVLTLGPDQGQDNNVVEATFAGNSGFPAAFAASGKTPGDPTQTTISGVVQDNSNNPIPGVTMRLFTTHQLTNTNSVNNNQPIEVVTPVTTDDKGAFKITQAPVGNFKLMADGATATVLDQQFPTLEYDIVTVAGQDNGVGTPIYLPALDPDAKVCVDETTGGVLKMSTSPGFSLTIAPGAATFPGGSKSGCVTVTPVNTDKVPMVPGFGQQPRYVVTIQPVGTTFNPPAAITIPNLDGLAPHAKTEMYSYDHDLASFVAIGSATVSADGAVIASDPGIGVIKAGWHCGGNPNTSGSAGHCPDCQRCQGSGCVSDDSKTPNDTKGDCKKPGCQGGAPTQMPDDNDKPEGNEALCSKCNNGSLEKSENGASCDDGKYCSSYSGTDPGPDQCEDGKCIGKEFKRRKKFEDVLEGDPSKYKAILEKGLVIFKDLSETPSATPSITGKVQRKINTYQECCESLKTTKESTGTEDLINVEGAIDFRTRQFPIPYTLGLLVIQGFVKVTGQLSGSVEELETACFESGDCLGRGSITGSAILEGGLIGSIGLLNPDILSGTVSLRGTGSAALVSSCGVVTGQFCGGPVQLRGKVTSLGGVSYTIVGLIGSPTCDPIFL